MKLKNHISLFALLILLTSVVSIQAQPIDANHPELKWRMFETEHFIIHFHDGSERTAHVIAKIAEEIHPKISAMYNYEPDTKFHFIVKDTDDYANGAAYYYNNKMLIWATALDYDLRGTVNWLRNVITHEYTHIIQLGAARKLPRFMPAIYFQVLDYEYEKRPDVLYGYPNVLASYPIAMTVMPMWFAEGTAQFNTPEFSYDYWDSHRDMQIRIRSLNDSLLTLNDMEVFGKNSMGNEGVYNHGFSLVSYIAETYGEESLSDLTHGLKSLGHYDFNRTAKQVLGVSGQEIYNNWKAHLLEGYLKKTDTIRENIQEGEPFERENYSNLYPKWSPDGEAIYYSSNLGSDYYSGRSIYKKSLKPDEDGEEAEAEVIVAGVSSPFDISSDGRWMVYSNTVRQRNESYYADLYLYDLEKEKKVRITRSARAMDPSFSPDGRSIACIINHDGTRDLALINLPASDEWMDMEILPSDSIHMLTDYDDGTQSWRPTYSPDGEWIAYARGRDLGRDIVIVRPDGSDERVVIGGLGDQREPSWSSDGKWLYYSSDETGIFNLYRYNLSAEESEPITNVLGATFMSDVHDDGRIVYVQYSEYGFELRTMESANPIDTEVMVYDPEYLENLPAVTYDDTKIEIQESVPYKPIFEQIFIVPRIAFDYGRFKPGLYFYSSDFLEKLFLFGGISANLHDEFDLFAMMEFKPFRPTLFLEGYYLQRTHFERFEDPFVIEDVESTDGDYWKPKYGKYGIDYTFKLLEVDGGLRLRLWTPVEMELRGIWSRYQAGQLYEDKSTFSYTYFIGRSVQTRFDFDYTVPSVRGNVHPKSGFRAQVTAAYEDNKFIDGFEIDADRYTIQEVYTPYKYLRMETEATTWYNPFGELVIQPRFKGGYLDHEVDPFMYIYAGGLHGMRGYSYYSLGGSRKIIGNLTLRHPLFVAPRPHFGWLHFDGLFAGIFADAGNAWIHGDSDGLSDLKTDIGVELRAKLYSWYGFPTALTFSAARALHEVEVTEFGETTHYDPEWKFYFTLLFDFETIFPSRKIESVRLR
ncbi:DPP IV N-terminal domain-containing protein [bacterium]|nr:DPP IV N-terminal domain-containing protein [bacterium]